MFKLVAVGGKIRGLEIELHDGSNVLGRSHDCEHVLAVDGISKKHVEITINNESCFLQDLGSSNGTFVNGKLVKKKTVVDKDKIALPNVIFQLVHVKEKKIVVTKKVLKGNAEGTDLDFGDAKPNDLPGKIKYWFKNTAMKVVYSFNEQYEWNVMLAIFLFMMTCGNIYLTIGPVLTKTQILIETEINERGKHIAEEIVRTNSRYLNEGNMQRINTSFLERLVDSGDVVSYELTDIQGRIVRPVSKIDTLDTDVFTAKAMSKFKSMGQKSYFQTFFDSSIFDGEVGVAKLLVVNDPESGQDKAVGLIAIRFKPDSLRQFSSMSAEAYLTALVMTTILGSLFFAIIYYLTIRPLLDMRRQTEDVLRGKKKDVDFKYLFEELNPFKNTINSILQKNRELMNDDSQDFAEIEEEGPYISIMYEVMKGSPGAAIVLSAEKNVEYVNEMAGDLTGMRENLVQGSNILDAASNEGFAGTLIKLCDDTANNGGVNQSDFYELDGDPYIINVMALMGKDSFAKAYLISFAREK